MTAAQPNARADIFPPSAKLTRSWSASGPSRRSQEFSSDYSSGPVGALPRHTIAHTRPSTTHQHAPRPDQPSETSPLTTFLAPFRAHRVTSATTFQGLALRVRRGAPRGARADIRISYCSSRAWRLCATKGAPESARRDGRSGPAFVCVRCTVRRVGGARLISPRL